MRWLQGMRVTGCLPSGLHGEFWLLMAVVMLTSGFLIACPEKEQSLYHLVSTARLSYQCLQL